jgi:ribosomal protein S18 acetylase RimI-like enzyme
MELRVTSHPDPLQVLHIEESVRRETVAKCGLGDDVSLAVFADDGGDLIGGCVGGTWGGTLELEALWVDPSRRRYGLGGRLLAAGEQEALARGCQQVVLFTHQVQAPGFYERHGYTVVGRVADYPIGVPALWFRKDLRH